MTVKDRIMEFCRMSGIKPGRFERECGLSNAYLSKLKHEPSRDKLGKIFARYPELNKGEFYQFNLSSCIRQQNSLTAQFVSFSLANLANIFYPPRFLQ